MNVLAKSTGTACLCCLHLIQTCYSPLAQPLLSCSQPRGWKDRMISSLLSLLVNFLIAKWACFMWVQCCMPSLRWLHLLIKVGSKCLGMRHVIWTSGSIRVGACWIYILGELLTGQILYIEAVEANKRDCSPTSLLVSFVSFMVAVGLLFFLALWNEEKPFYHKG